MANRDLNHDPRGRAPKPSSNERFAADQRRTRNRNRGLADTADWASADPSRVCNAIASVTSNGYAIRFGYTRDGGAFAIGVIGDGDPYTDFVRPTEDIDAYLQQLIDAYHK